MKYIAEGAALVVATLVAVAATRRAMTRQVEPSAVLVIPVAERTTLRAGTERLMSASSAILRSDPFQLGPRRINRVATSRTGSSPIPSPTLRPALSVQAIIGGPPWSALVAGIPQQHGAIVVRQGFSAGEYRVTSVSRDTVVVAAPDTVWRLTLKREAP